MKLICELQESVNYEFIEEGSEKGKKVVLNPLITCGECNYCKNGREHLCAKRIILGMNKNLIQ